MRVWDLKNKRYYEEIEYGKDRLDFLYNTFFGRIMLKLIFSSRWFSKFQALYQRSKFSKSKIKRFVNRYSINLDEYESISNYSSFSDFFRRKREIINRSGKKELVAIADSKVQVYDISSNLILSIKRCRYDVTELLQDSNLAKEYENGKCIVYRLSVDDYHRYMYLDNGEIVMTKRIDGKLHTIRPISYKYNSFTSNSREVCVINTENFGQVVQIEIGAMLVGKIVNNNNKYFNKLEEKGYFDYGGSTIVQLFKKDTISIEEEIMEKSKLDIETKVEIGMKIGEKYV